MKIKAYANHFGHPGKVYLTFKNNRGIGGYFCCATWLRTTKIKIPWMGKKEVEIEIGEIKEK